jgi:hypothetical protein
MMKIQVNSALTGDGISTPGTDATTVVGPEWPTGTIWTVPCPPVTTMSGIVATSGKIVKRMRVGRAGRPEASVTVTVAVVAFAPLQVIVSGEIDSVSLLAGPGVAVGVAVGTRVAVAVAVGGGMVAVAVGGTGVSVAVGRTAVPVAVAEGTAVAVLVGLWVGV